MSNAEDETRPPRKGVLGMVSKIHGAGESLRGTFNASIDQAVHGKILDSDRAAINRGQEEYNTGRHVRTSDKHYDTPSSLERNRQQARTGITGDKASDIPVYKPEQEPGMSAGTTMGHDGMGQHEPGRVPHHPGDPTMVETGQRGPQGGADVYSNLDPYHQGYLEGRSVGHPHSANDRGPEMHGGAGNERVPHHPGDPTRGMEDSSMRDNSMGDVHHYSNREY